MIEKTYKVTGMSCGHCAMHVKNAIEGLEGVESCKVDLAEGSMTVKFDEKRTALEELREALEEAGYGLQES